ncbi:MAG TPA: PSD1 and planctomycete cytochrome C domain-containing protein [Gemmataceae bacterium]|nr:PSD1 and planctomycete cytochrome C domain-containing protein [Gemmataceae bacterium]
MHRILPSRFFLALSVVAAAGLVVGLTRPPKEARADGPAPARPAIDFNRQIRPILSENCFACHGPDEKARKAKLRLDTKEGLLREVRSGLGRVVEPGKSAASDLIQRVTADEPHRLMPPPKSGKKPLKPEQVALLKEWIDQGAPWSSHWAFLPPKRPPLPKVADRQWVREPLDAFILARLEAEGLRPNPEADKATLIRRVTLDLTGLPPTPEEVDAFLTDQTPEAYERVVDRLLRSPRYGEHMARFWLDAARYGDTHGLHLDNYREIWPYREWVIKAFNRNLPYDRFVIEQLAGDLLPDPTLDQRVATGFTRAHVTTSEGGSIPEECYVRNVVDRVDTFGTVFLGVTTGCCRCHDHKYDPLTMKDYYSLFAFFNSLDDNPLDGNAAKYPPVVKVPTAAHTRALELIRKKADALRRQIAEEVAKVQYNEPADAREPEQPQQRAEFVWIDDAVPAGKQETGGGVNVAWSFVPKDKHPVHSGSASLRLKANGLKQVVLSEAKSPLRVGEGDVLFAHVWIDPKDPPKEIMLQWHSDAWRHRAYWGDNVIPWGNDNSPERRQRGALPEKGKWVRLEVPAAEVGLKPGTVVTGWAFTQHGGTAYWDRAGLVTKTPQGSAAFHTLTAWVQAQRAAGGAGLPKPVADLVKIDRAKRTDAQQKQLRDYFIEHAYARERARFAPLHKELAALEKQREQVEASMPTTLVANESPAPKPAYILKRGEYDQRGQQVGREVPAFLPPLPKGAPANRLGLAQWLVARDNPLTARVEVNRLWQQVFGTGLVKTAEDFGSQGEPPSHPELLDWLAVRFMDDGWDMKKMMKRLVMSSTYRQSAKVTKEKLAKDRDNRLLSRGPRFRLDAEVLRDQALFVSGLLVERLGGPSVKPPQPRGLWEAVGYTGSNTRNFVPDKGVEKVHRRSLYTFWKRTAPPPQMSTFDAPSRESCTVRRERTNTPLQALLLLNEKQYVECARALAERVLREGGKTPEERATYLFRLATARKPDAQELAQLVGVYKGQHAEYAHNAEAAKKLIAVGESKPDPKLDPAELAAWTMVANVVLNLDEVLNKG